MTSEATKPFGISYLVLKWCHDSLPDISRPNGRQQNDPGLHYRTPFIQRRFIVGFANCNILSNLERNNRSEFFHLIFLSDLLLLLDLGFSSPELIRKSFQEPLKMLYLLLESHWQLKKTRLEDVSSLANTMIYS